MRERSKTNNYSESVTHKLMSKRLLFIEWSDHNTKIEHTTKNTKIEHTTKNTKIE